MKEVVLMVNGKEAYVLRGSGVGEISGLEVIVDGLTEYIQEDEPIKVDSGKDRKPLVVRVSFTKEWDSDHSRRYCMRMYVEKRGELPFNQIFGEHDVQIHPLAERSGCHWNEYVGRNRYLTIVKDKAEKVETEIREQYMAFLDDLDAEPELPEPYTISI